MRGLGSLILLAFVSPAPAAAQAPPTPACAGAEYRTLDFWVGDWIAEDQQGHRIGTNHITRDEYGNCVITEHFHMDDGTLTGHSVSLYRPGQRDRKSTRLNSSHLGISYAVLCLKKNNRAARAIDE